MKDIQVQWQARISQVLAALYQKASLTDFPSPSKVVLEIPPKSEMGDLAFPMFSYAKALKTSPVLLAKSVAQELSADDAEVLVLGPYVNLKLSKKDFSDTAIRRVLQRGKNYGEGTSFSGKKVMVEFSSPNTNKPLHLGHLRNNTLGEAVARILKASGAEVRKVNLINDRGIHICKSMLAYTKFSQGETPESTKQKSDHFVGDYYVKFAQWAKEDPTAETQAQELLRAWESSDPQTLKLWKQMNEWAVEGIKKTYDRTGIKFDQIYYESKTYQKGKEEITKGLAAGFFYKREDGAVVVDLPWKNSPEDEANAQKVLLRADGTSIYLTQDIGTAISRHGDWPFDQFIYVVANEQDYHFKVLFYVLKLLGLSWAQDLFHLSYGMVNLPEGRMKSREGTVVDADNLIDELRDGAAQEISSKGREDAVDGLENTAELIALGALHYYLLQASPAKDMIFNPQETLSFNGNTGPYLQYTGARICSMIEKAKLNPPQGTFKAQLLTTPEEWDLIKLIDRFPDEVEKAANLKDPSIIAAFLYDLAKSFSKFYHDHPVLNAQDSDTASTRLELSKAVLQVLENGFDLLNIPFLHSM